MIFSERAVPLESAARKCPRNKVVKERIGREGKFRHQQGIKNRGDGGKIQGIPGGCDADLCNVAGGVPFDVRLTDGANDPAAAALRRTECDEKDLVFGGVDQRFEF